MKENYQYNISLFGWIVFLSTVSLVLWGCTSADFASYQEARQAAGATASEKTNHTSYKCSACKDRGWDRLYAGRTIPGPCLYCNQAGLYGNNKADEESDYTPVTNLSLKKIETKYVIMHGNKYLCTVLRDITDNLELCAWQKINGNEIPFPPRECKPRRVLKGVWINQELHHSAEIRVILKDRRGRLLGDTGWICVDDLPMEQEFRHTYQ